MRKLGRIWHERPVGSAFKVLPLVIDNQKVISKVGESQGDKSVGGGPDKGIRSVHTNGVVAAPS
tara:strand:- start:175 stop:366 length:192 start_codon:yes stop_codon:yes gene_type:complete